LYCHFKFGAMSGTSGEDAPSLAAASQSWNWVALSQQSSGSDGSSAASSARSSGVQGRRNAAQTSARPMLHRTPTSTQSDAKPKTISTAAERAEANSGKTDTGEAEEFSRLRIADRTISAEVLRQEMAGRKVIKLQQMDRVPKDTFTNGEVRCDRSY
jgi:hypothetical protein